MVGLPKIEPAESVDIYLDSRRAELGGVGGVMEVLESDQIRSSASCNLDRICGSTYQQDHRQISGPLHGQEG